MPLRWGFLSTAEIGRKNWRSLRASGAGTLVAVASRDAERARRFISDCQKEAPFPQAPRALGDYAELLAAPDIDAVYIPIPTGLRKEWVIRAANAGKHVLCEKPCAVSAADLREMIAACRRAKVQFMDGVLYMHSERMALMRAALDAGSAVGRMRRVTSAFCFRGNETFFDRNIRSHSVLEPMGCLGDLGWYCIRFSLWAAGWRSPASATGRILASGARRDSPAPVPTEFSGELIFEDGLSAGFYCSFETQFQQWARVDGDQGALVLDDFVLPRESGELAFHAGGQRIVVDERAGPRPTQQEENMFRNFAQAAGQPTPSDFWPDISLKTQEVLDACYHSARHAVRNGDTH